WRRRWRWRHPSGPAPPHPPRCRRTWRERRHERRWASRRGGGAGPPPPLARGGGGGMGAGNGEGGAGGGGGCGVVGGGGWGRAPPEKKPRGADAPRSPDTVEVTGTVVSPNGKPVSGAKVFFVRNVRNLREKQSAPPAVRAISGADGRFRFRVAATGYRTEEEK